MEPGKKTRSQPSAVIRNSVSRERHSSDPAACTTPWFWQKFAIIAGFSLVLSLLVTPFYMVLPVSYRLGDVADHDIKAVRDFLITDEGATERKRLEAASKSLAVYDLDEEAVQHLRQRLSTSFAMMRGIFQKPVESVAGKEDPKVDFQGVHKSPRELALERKKEFEQKLGATLADRDFAVLVEEKFNPRLEGDVLHLTSTVLDTGVVGNKSLLLSQVQKGITLRSVQSGAESKEVDLLGFLSLEDARRQMRLRAGTLVDESRRVLEAVVHLAQAVLQPTITFNRNETELRRQQAVEAVKPVLFQVKKGEMIVREGQRVGDEERLKLEMQAQGKLERGAIFTMVGAALLVGLLTWVSFNTAGRYVRKFPGKAKDLLFLITALTVFLLLAKLSVVVAEALNNTFPFISSSAILYILPMAAGAMLVTIFFGPLTAIFFAFVLALLSGFLLDRQFEFLFYYLLGSLAAIQGVEVCRDRSTPLKAGLTVSLINVAVIVVLSLSAERMFSPQTGVALLSGITGGLLSGVVTTGLCPLVEMAFGYTTDIKLLELANMDQPVLRELMVWAPGSYHHSLVVGNMVEAAAKSIGANSLLARVAAYYHDIGKIKKPQYFVENQAGGENRHERLAPSMSSLILISHVKDGVELAKQHRLGQAIQDIIQQHHGTSVISYFYQKALDVQEKLRSSKGAISSVQVDDYRYPGPKPQTKEAGLVMLADAVEAASRTLAEPTASRVQGLVQKIINKIFSDGQLDECELTLKDLNEIAKSFIQILTAILHQRIDYPEAAANGSEARVRTNGDPDHKSARRDRNGLQADRSKGKEGLKRLGIS